MEARLSSSEEELAIWVQTLAEAVYVSRRAFVKNMNLSIFTPTLGKLYDRLGFF